MTKLSPAVQWIEQDYDDYQLEEPRESDYDSDLSAFHIWWEAPNAQRSEGTGTTQAWIRIKNDNPRFSDSEVQRRFHCTTCESKQHSCLCGAPMTHMASWWGDDCFDCYDLSLRIGLRRLKRYQNWRQLGRRITRGEFS